MEDSPVVGSLPMLAKYSNSLRRQTLRPRPVMTPKPSTGVQPLSATRTEPPGPLPFTSMSQYASPSLPNSQQSEAMGTRPFPVNPSAVPLTSSARRPL
jgi:hypothetical protein